MIAGFWLLDLDLEAVDRLDWIVIFPYVYVTSFPRNSADLIYWVYVMLFFDFLKPRFYEFFFSFLIVVVLNEIVLAFLLLLGLWRPQAKLAT